MPSGALALSCLLVLLLLWPILLMDFMLLALMKLGISPALGLLLIFGILLGSLINIPVKRLPAHRDDFSTLRPLYGLSPGRWFLPRLQTGVLAINVGGCLIPLLLCGYQLLRLTIAGDLLLSLLVIAINVIACFHLSRFIPGLGVAMSPLLPGLLAALCALLLVPNNAPSAAFCAGVLGPVVGADLLRLPQLYRTGTSYASIGGAGTFDGIVLTGFIALLLA